MTAPIRARWQEEGGRYIIADKHSNGEWEFADKDCGDVRWFPLKSTPALIAAAEAILAQRINASVVECSF